MELAESRHGQEIHALTESGIPIAPSQQELTPLQRFVYVLAADEHTEDPKGMQKGHGATRRW